MTQPPGPPQNLRGDQPQDVGGILGSGTQPQQTQSQIQSRATHAALALVQQQQSVAKQFAQQFPHAAKSMQMVISGWQQALDSILGASRPPEEAPQAPA
ncbi:MAG: hypothetical protein ACRD22_09900 [Terriglobia bacterium]